MVRLAVVSPRRDPWSEFLALFDESPSTETLTAPAERSTDHTSVVSGTAPSNLATGSGIVVRTDGEDSLTRTTADRNLPAIDARGTASVSQVDNDSLSVGLPIDQSFKRLLVNRLPIAYGRGFGKMGREATVDKALELRVIRGREIASRPETIEELRDNEWSVPSQTGFSRYKVTSHRGLWECGCKDFARRGEPCKHILAVRQLIAPSPGGRVAKPPRKQYPQSPAYTRGQTEELRLVDTLLRDLVAAVPDAPRLAGYSGPTPLPLSESLYCAILKVYSGLSGRRARGIYVNAHERGLLSAPPSFMVASRALNRPEATNALYGLLRLSAAPLIGLEEGEAIAPDSTGVQTTSFGAWREEKHGEKRLHRWLKVHALVGTRTHIVIRARILEEHSGDSPEFGGLVRGAFEDGFRPGSIVADRGYLSKENYETAADLGIEAFIPFKSNSLNRSGHRGSPASWRKAYYLFKANREEFDRRYHRRSNVEAVFSALKRKFGENVRSRTPVAQVNEILCKLIAYNLTVVIHEMFENGIAPSFANDSTRGLEGVGSES